MVKITTLFLIAALAPAAHAQMQDGNKLMEWLAADERIDGGRETPVDYISGAVLTGFVSGVSDSNLIYHCAPPNASNKQLVAVVRQFMRRHPEKWSAPAWILTISALNEAFPCQKNENKPRP